MFSNLQPPVGGCRVNTTMPRCNYTVNDGIFCEENWKTTANEQRYNVHRLRWFSVICSCYFIEPLFVFYSFICAAIVVSSSSEKCLRSAIWRDRNEDPVTWSITNQVYAHHLEQLSLDILKKIYFISTKFRPNDIWCYIAGRVRSKFRTIKKAWTFSNIPGRRNIWWRGFQYSTNSKFVDKPSSRLHRTAGDMRTWGTHGGRIQFANDIICE